MLFRLSWSDLPHQPYAQKVPQGKIAGYRAHDDL